MKKYIALALAILFFCGGLGYYFFLYQHKEALSPEELEAKERRLIVTLNRIDSNQEINDVMRRRYENVYFDLGEIYFNKKDFDKAIALYERGLTINSWRTDKVFELALAYKNKGLYKEAYDRFRQVLILKPDILTFLKTKWELFRIKNKPEVLDGAKKVKQIEQAKLKDLTIYILPFGVDNKEMLEDLKVLLQDAFAVKFNILNPLPAPAKGFDAGRKQYFIIPLLKYAKTEYESVFFAPGTYTILIVTSYDITDEGINFIFGGSDPDTGLGIVSHNRFMLDHPDSRELFKRIYTQCLSTTGFLLGMPRCSTPGCARSYPHSLGEFKRKSYKLCPECRNNFNNLFWEKIKYFPETDWSAEDLLRLEEARKKYRIE